MELSRACVLTPARMPMCVRAESCFTALEPMWLANVWYKIIDLCAITFDSKIEGLKLLTDNT